jgi:hypothetical protein
MYVICNKLQTECFAGIVKTDTGLKQLWYPFPPNQWDNYTLFINRVEAEKVIKDCGLTDKIPVRL